MSRRKYPSTIRNTSIVSSLFEMFVRICNLSINADAHMHGYTPTHMNITPYKSFERMTENVEMVEKVS